MTVRAVLTGLSLATLLVAAAPAATHAAQAPASVQVGEDRPDVFSLRNLTDRPLIVTDVRVSGRGTWSRGFDAAYPYPGQLIPSGATVFTDLWWSYNGPAGVIIPSTAYIDFTIGVGGPLVRAFVYQNGQGWPLHQTAYGCNSTDPAWTCAVDGAGHGADVYLTTATDITIPASEPATQVRLMNALCQPGNPAVHCGFAEPSRTLTEVQIPFHHVGDVQYNYTEETSEHSWTQEWETGTMVEQEASYIPVSVDVMEVVSVEVKVTWGREWGNSSSTSVTNGVDIPPDHVGWIEAEIPALRVVGDLRVGIGNQWWTLKDATFTTPRADDKGEFHWIARGMTRPMTPDELAARPPTP